MNTLFYDVEATDQWAPYCTLTLIGFQYNNDPPECIPWPIPPEFEPRARELRERLASPAWVKVSFNGINYDDIVLRRHGFPVNTTNSHDVYLQAKTVAPTLPAYGLKFLSWYFFIDHHQPEGHRKHMIARNQLTAQDDVAYNTHDVVQTHRLFDLFYPLIQKPLHRDAYKLELEFAPVLHEMILEGGEYISPNLCKQKIRELMEEQELLGKELERLTGGNITNANSHQQVSTYFKEFDNIELELSDKGNLHLRQSELLSLINLKNPRAQLVYDIRGITKQLGYLRNYNRAATYEADHNNGSDQTSKSIWRIPANYSTSRARTRRILSSSKFGINFQNPDHIARTIQLVPVGFLGCWIDQTQIENVVHIWASEDQTRRRAYEADTSWNEYVWLANQILGGSHTREQLDKMPSPLHSGWSVYKHFKTVKLAMNFFMGIAKFCRYNGISTLEGKLMFDQVHQACPAIKQLLHKVKSEIEEKGYIQDPFGHIYSGPVESAYRIVAYFIQGCGTGSVTKAVSRAIYNTLHPMDKPQLGIMNGVLHDEVAFRIRVDLSDKEIIDTIKSCLFDATGRFSHKFSGIPIRAKLKVSTTNCAASEEINHYKLSPEEWEKKVLEHVYDARGKAGIL